jgi:hypothetical protein
LNKPNKVQTYLFNKVEIVKINELDGLEFKSATFVYKTFPTHFYLDWSLVFIKSGSEQIGWK